jgi:hypothetical protein
MTAIQISEGRRFRLPKAIRQFPASLKATGISALKSYLFRPAHDTHWRSLNERLLRDIGKSPIDAEIARLQARLGADAADIGQRAAYRLEAQGLGRGLRRSDIEG